MSRLLEGAANSSNYTFIILMGVILVLFLLMRFFANRRDKRLNEEKGALIDSFRKGTKIITTFGVYGVIEEIKETTDGKVVLISTGEGKEKTYMNVHINAIMNIDKKQNVVYDSEGNDITPYDDVDDNINTDIIQNSENENITNDEAVAEDINASGEEVEKVSKKSSAKRKK